MSANLWLSWLRSAVWPLGVALLVTGSAGAQPRGPGFHVIELPNSGASKQLQTLLETPHLKLTSVPVPANGQLASHSAPDPVTIQILAGKGSLKLSDGKVHALAPGRMFYLAPRMEHSISADSDSSLLLLVHHLKSMRPGRSGGRPGPGPGPGGP